MAKKFYIRKCIESDNGGYICDILELTEAEASTIYKFLENVPSWCEPTVTLLAESFDSYDDAVRHALMH